MEPMSTDKITAKQRVLAALADNGWEDIRQHYVIDAEGNSLRNITGPYNRATGLYDMIPLESIVATGVYDRKAATLEVFFTATGAYKGRDIAVAGVTFRGCPTTLSDTMKRIAEYSPTAVRARQQAQDQARAAKEAEHEVAVAEAYAQITETLRLAEEELLAFLGEIAQLEIPEYMTIAPVEMEVALEHAGRVIMLRSQKARIGQGWLPGQSSLTGTYVDGVRVDKVNSMV